MKRWLVPTNILELNLIMFDKKNIEKGRLCQKQYYEDRAEYDQQYYEKNRKKILGNKK